MTTCNTRAIPVAPSSELCVTVASRLLALQFGSIRGHECPSLVSVVCWQVVVTSTGLSLVQRGPTECGVSECDLEMSTMREPRPNMAVEE
jgi:hypothetical protein